MRFEFIEKEKLRVNKMSFLSTVWPILLLFVICIITSNPQGMVPPVQSEEAVWKNYIATTKVPHFGPIAFEHEEIVDHEKSVVNQMTKISFIGNKETVKNQILDLKRRVEFDELMINSYIYDEEAQHYSYELLKEVIDEINE